MDILNIVHKEFNKGQRKARKSLIQDIIKGNDSREALSKNHRVSSNKIADIRRFIIELNKGENFKFLGVSGYRYEFNF